MYFFGPVTVQASRILVWDTSACHGPPVTSLWSCGPSLASVEGSLDATALN